MTVISPFITIGSGPTLLFQPFLPTSSPSSLAAGNHDTDASKKRFERTDLKNFPENYNMIMTMGNLHIIHIFQWEINIFKTVDFPLSC